MSIAGRIALLYRLEIMKAFRRRQSWIGPGLLVAVILLAPLVHPITRDGTGDYSFIAYVTPLSLNLLGYLMLLAFSAALVVSETERGVARGVLVRPVRRSEFIVAKLLTAFSYAALLTALTGAASWGVAALRGDLLGVHLGGELVYTGDAMIAAYAGGALLSLLPQWAGASLAILFSTAARGTGTAVSLSLGTWIAIDLVKYPLGIAPFVFTTYLDAPWQVFAHRGDALEYPWFPMAWQCALSSAPVIAASAALSLYIFNRRNLGSC
ncbi:MAG: ABC transporter permease [Candidatus Hydrogenedentes bacterium]|nr:ABC transporter permease [Candidatus Hydrogenedentota bacterium]